MLSEEELSVSVQDKVMPHKDPIKRAEYKRRWHEANKERLAETKRYKYLMKYTCKVDYIHCPECGSLFTSSNHRRKYCSSDCGKSAHDRQHGKRFSSKIHFNDCQQCGKKFTTQMSWQKFCSSLCQGRFHRENLTISYCKTALSNKSSLTPKEIPTCMAELYRERMKIKRYLEK